MIKPAKDKELIKIVKYCLSIDKKASEIYLLFSEKSKDKELKEFWKKMSQEEDFHVEFWEKLLHLTEMGMIPQVFEDPKKIVKEVESIDKKIYALNKECETFRDVSRAFFLSYRMEFYLLHPAFETLFHFLKIFDKEKNPEDDYANHIDQFIIALNKYGNITPELQLLGETLQRLWRENKNLATLSLMDDSTSVLNKRGFFNIIEPMMYLASRNNNMVGFMMLDIDNFKKVNDTHGHYKGDKMLKKVAAILKGNIRKTDIVGRFGGDEFIIFLPKISDTIKETLGEKLRERIEEETKDDVSITVSIGISYGKISQDIEKVILRLLEKADQNLYKAKNSCRNRVVD